ncbi:N-acetylmuramoyl-L-alanine amidase [Gammaproteobacteria bacterium]
MKSKKIMKGILYSIAIVGLFNAVSCYASEVAAEVVINKSEMLKSKHGLEKMYAPATYAPSFIVLHYAVTTTIGQTVNAYYGAGVSAHYTVDKDGTIFQHVEDGNIAYHAGLSYWRGKYSLNWYAKGIEQVNTGSDVNNKPWKEPRSFKEADGREWETWSEVQIKSTAELVKSLVEQHNIKSWNIIGHSDCSCGRKDDPGPLFPWKKMHDEYGVGFWPDEDTTITKELTNELNNKDYMCLLHAFGYPIKGFASSVENGKELEEMLASEEELKGRSVSAKVERNIQNMNGMSNGLTDRETISSFQHHYMQDKFENDSTYRSGRLDDDTQLIILKCIKSIIKNVDKDDYSLRMLEKMYQSDLSNEAEKLIESFNQDGKLGLKAKGEEPYADL